MPTLPDRPVRETVRLESHVAAGYGGRSVCREPASLQSDPSTALYRMIFAVMSITAATDSLRTEEQLIAIAQDAISNCRWTVGECAAQWTQRYSRGRTDADFAQLIGLSPDQVFQRRRVWERFAANREQFASLKWSHFYTALNWDDAEACLHWALETESTVAEMKAWRRSQRGEDLSSPADELLSDHWMQIPGEPVAVGVPDGNARPGWTGPRGNPDDEPPFDVSGSETADRLAGVARQQGNDPSYSPFRSDAMQVPEREPAEDRPAPPPLSPEVIVKRMTSTLERCTKVLTPEFSEEFQALPEAMRTRFFKALNDLRDRVSQLR